MLSRIQALRAKLESEGCDAFVSFSPPANEYLSGFAGTASAVIVTAREALFFCDFRYTEQAASQVRDFEVREMPGTLEIRAGEQLKAMGVQNVAYDGTVMTVWQLETVQTAFGGEMVSRPRLVMTLRMCKDAEETARLRAAVDLADHAVLAVVDGLREGVSEREAAALLEYEFKRRGAQGSSFDSIVLFGARSSLPHGMPGDKPLERGDIVLIDCGCRRAGYCSDLTRTYAFDTIDNAWFEEVYEITLAAQLKALEAVRPGASCREVDAAARDLIEAAGYGLQFGHGTGHGVGIEIHEAPRLNRESDVILEAGMAVTVEPGIYLPGRGGVRIEDLVIVTDDGCDVLSRIPKQLKVLGA